MCSRGAIDIVKVFSSIPTPSAARVVGAQHTRTAPSHFRSHGGIESVTCGRLKVQRAHEKRRPDMRPALPTERANEIEEIEGGAPPLDQRDSRHPFI